MTNDEILMKPKAPITKCGIRHSTLMRHSSFVIRHLTAALAVAAPLHAAPVGTTVFEATSAHHHIRVYDDNGLRTLSFDGSMETRMSLSDPSQGHFEYTEHFHMPWLWNGL